MLIWLLTRNSLTFGKILRGGSWKIKGAFWQTGTPLNWSVFWWTHFWSCLSDNNCSVYWAKFFCLGQSCQYHFFFEGLGSSFGPNIQIFVDTKGGWVLCYLLVTGAMRREESWMLIKTGSNEEMVYRPSGNFTNSLLKGPKEIRRNHYQKDRNREV